ncbi:MAG: alpha/beta hydrolase [Hamadaea sp.]|nr:alpha/beta hydrolase [Hamadaea sp.]NUR46764.1 alpha/beta hydrolase [Hamadaea sp.]NUT07475.1 alpha/beta hydrolase [Hamadaea sp.]
MTPAIKLTGRLLDALSVTAPPLARRLAWELFRRPVRRARVHPHEQAAHAAAVREHYTVDGVRVAAYRWGDGDRPVLLLHGWSSRGSRFAALATELARRGHTAIAVDAPGHGDSGGDSTTVPQYARLVHAIQQRHGDFRGIAGHSLGVLTAFHALRTGVRADAIVTVSGIADFGHLLREFARQLRLRPPVTDDVRRRLEKLLGDDDIWTRLSSDHQPEHVTQPLLILHDADDDFVGVDHAHRLHQAYPHAELVITEGLGHRGVLADPRVFGPAADWLSARAGAAPLP